MKKCSRHACDNDSLREDSFYGTRFGEYALIALAILVNSFLIGFGLSLLAPYGGWIETVALILSVPFWIAFALAALFLIFGTYVQIRICRTHRRNKRKNIDNTTNNSTVKQ